MRSEPIDAVLVTYNPNCELLNKVVNSISSQVRKMYIVDNTPDRAKCLSNFLEYENIETIYLDDNKGIAYAQNIGIKKSIEDKSNYILLSDQDTIYPDDYILDMIQAINKCNDDIAAIAPLYKDSNRRKKNEGFIKKSYFLNKKIYPESGLHEIYQAIASGKILNTKYLNKIGVMDENLFIDWVDLEWCWRSVKRGYKIIGNANVIITHHMGDKAINIGFKEISLRNPIRSYYITRNAIHLALRCDSLNFLQKATIVFKTLRYLVAFPILAKPHMAHLEYAMRGFWHGLTGKLGKLNDPT